MNMYHERCLKIQPLPPQFTVRMGRPCTQVVQAGGAAGGRSCGSQVPRDEEHLSRATNDGVASLAELRADEQIGGMTGIKTSCLAPKCKKY